MTGRIDELERAASQTREELARTVSRIEERLTPRRIVTGHPVATIALLGAVGGFVAWLLSRGGDRD
jgi:hypothetical protein